MQLGEERHTLPPGEAINMPLGAHHALGNDTEEPVVVVKFRWEVISARMTSSGSATLITARQRQRQHSWCLMRGISNQVQMAQIPAVLFTNKFSDFS